jgi:hypothetical protein
MCVRVRLAKHTHIFRQAKVKMASVSVQMSSGRDPAHHPRSVSLLALLCASVEVKENEAEKAFFSPALSEQNHVAYSCHSDIKSSQLVYYISFLTLVQRRNHIA